MTDTNTEESNSQTKSPTKEAANTESPKSSPSKKDIDIATQALNLFAQGKRHLLVSDISSAVNSLQDACRLLGEHYGETAPECADAYFYYGKSLLELARIENGVLGNALDGEEGSTEEEDNAKEEGEGSQDEEEGDSQEENEEPAENGEPAEEVDGEKTEDSEEEEVGNLQLAWEMFELAKVIYTKQLESNPSMNLKLAQVYLKLGEVSLENENYTQSVEDLKNCLEIQMKELSTDDRCLAETHYQLGVAHSFSDDFDKAMESFGSAAKVIEERICNLEKLQKEKAEWSEEQKMKDAADRKDPFYTEATEIEELQKLLPEIKEKIVDMEEMKKDSKERLQKFKESAFASVLGGSSRASGESTSAGESSTGFAVPDAVSSTPSAAEGKPAASISHLVRKKRKPEDEVEKEEAKKSKGENGEEMKPAVAANGEETKPAASTNGEEMKPAESSNGEMKPPATVNGKKMENGTDHASPEKAEEKMETEAVASKTPVKATATVAEPMEDKPSETAST